MLHTLDINCKTVTILFYLLIIQFTVYNRTITRFIADDKVVHQRMRREIRLASDNLQLSTSSFEACELEITVNYFSVYTWKRMTVSYEIERVDRWIFGLSCWLSIRCSTTTRRTWSIPLPDSGQLYPPFGFSLADCRCFQVTNPCRAIHSMLSVDRTALTDRYLIGITSSCEIFIILFNFCWYLGLDNFPR